MWVLGALAFPLHAQAVVAEQQSRSVSPKADAGAEAGAEVVGGTRGATGTTRKKQAELVATIEGLREQLGREMQEAAAQSRRHRGL